MIDLEKCTTISRRIFGWEKRRRTYIDFLSGLKSHDEIWYLVLVQELD